MVKHVVMWNLLAFADGHSREENIARMIDWLNTLPQRVPQIIEWEVGSNAVPHQDGYDIVLVSTFKSLEDLKIYQDSGPHVEVRDKIRKVRLNRRFVDFIIE